MDFTDGENFQKGKLEFTKKIMLASELITLLENEIKSYGDLPVIAACECGSDEFELYPNIAFHTDQNGKKSYGLHCYECSASFRQEEIAAGENY